MESSFTFARVRGVEIGANWSWLLVFAIVVWSLATALFPATYPGLDGTTYLLMAAAAAVLFFGSILLHELGHAFRAVAEGIPIEGITLWLLGGVSRLRGVPPSPGAEFRVAIAGPLITLGLAAAFFGAAALGDGVALADPAQGVLDYVARINLLVLGFNLIPALPLDGGRVLRSYLWRRQGAFEAATRSASRAGQAFGAVLIGIGLLGLFTGAGVGGIWFAFIGWFLVQAAQAELVHARLRSALGGVTVGQLMTRDPATVDARATVGDFVEQARRERHSTYPVVEDGRLVGVMTLRRAADLAPERRGDRVVEAMVPFAEVVTARAERPVIDALEDLGSSGDRRIVVTDGDGRPVGIVSTGDVAHALEVRRVEPRADRPRPAGVAVWLVVGLILLLAAGYLYTPPYLVISPGDTIDVADDITITGRPVDEVDGRYLLTSVRVSQRNALRTVIAAMRPDRTVVSRDELLPRGVRAEEYAERQRELFRESRRVAAAAAARAVGLDAGISGTGARILDVVPDSPAADHLRAGDVVVEADGQPVEAATDLREVVGGMPAGADLRLVVERDGERRTELLEVADVAEVSGGVGIGVLADTRDLEVSLPFDVDFVDRPDVAGPSAGVAYALAIADLLDERDLAAGRTVAATGTIQLDGDVGPVGGVAEKAIAAEQDGADVLLVPEGEADEVEDPELDLRGVGDLSQAIEYLRSTA